jgi:hypothetical protein
LNGFIFQHAKDSSVSRHSGTARNSAELEVSRLVLQICAEAITLSQDRNYVPVL